MTNKVFSFLFTVVAMLLVLPSDAAVAVRKQALNKTSQAPDEGQEKDPADTENFSCVCITLDGVHSARIYADAEGNTHLAVKQTELSQEVEITPESIGFNYDELPRMVQNAMYENPSLTVIDAYEAVAKLYETQGKTDIANTYRNAIDNGIILNQKDFWDNASIFLGGYETENSTINTTLTMTGGRVYSIVAAGYGYNTTLDQKTRLNQDNGTAVINIQGGRVNFVAPSTPSTKYFAGTVKIYMQNCTYAGDDIPNFADPYCTATVVSTGVNGGRLNFDQNSDNYCKAAYAVLQEASGAVMCKGKDSNLIDLVAGLSPVDCTTFTIASGTQLSTSVNITASEGLYINDSNPRDTKFLIYSPAVVTTPFIDATSRSYTNGGTINFTTCKGFTGWEVNAFDRVVTIPDHSFVDNFETREETDAILGVKLRDNHTTCQVCGKHDPAYGQVSYSSLYDVTDKEFTSALTENVLFEAGITYSRNYADGYQPLYLPFALSYDAWRDNADIYRLNNIHEYDDDNDGNVDRWTLEIIKLKEGQSTKPNVPYVIKPKEAGVITLQSDENARLVLTDAPVSADCSSLSTRFVFTGTPASKTIPANTDLYMSPDGLCYGTRDVTLGTYRWYMSIYDRETGEKIIPSQFNATKNITVFCEEDGDIATGTLILEENETVPDDAVIYDLNGQRVSRMIDGKIYIINGKKVKK